MSIYNLKNEFLTLQIEELGAELISIYDNIKDLSYLWNADPSYWKRHSPVLFPFVGSTRNKTYTYRGQEYPMTQHGFARDMVFTVFDQKEDELWLFLESNPETIKIYPFPFRLEIGYRLEGNKITVLWKVYNKGNTVMFFSIGGHPAFNCPLHPSEEQSDYYFSFDTTKPLRYLLADEKGLEIKKTYPDQNILSTDHGILPIHPKMFDRDALIIEDHQCHKVSLLDPAKKPFLTVSFDAPLFGLWSPTGKKAPFICIEPWYGRCDASDFCGTLEEREYGNSLEVGEVFEAQYTIEIL